MILAGGKHGSHIQVFFCAEARGNAPDKKHRPQKQTSLYHKKTVEKKMQKFAHIGGEIDCRPSVGLEKGP